jgi:catechol 2,3-dioxygenase-like lactoylglutathione lyase family enzyme
MAEERVATEVLGLPPRSGWARMALELHVNNLGASLSFWRGVLGFETTFERSEERFAYLEHREGHQIMLCQRHGRFETGPLDFPLGQGAMLQIYFGSIESVLSALGMSNWPIYLGPREVWRRTGDCESGQREVFVQDPDGYLLMIAENIGRRPLLEAIGP